MIFTSFCAVIYAAILEVILTGPPVACNVASPAHDTCYRHQCVVTTKLIAEKLGLAEDKYSFSFQSRLAGEQWLRPYTDFRLRDMPKERIKKLLTPFIFIKTSMHWFINTLENIQGISQEIMMLNTDFILLIKKEMKV